MPNLFDRPVACVDVETTGTSPQHDRITEIGIVEMAPDGTLSEWSTLVNPQARIPPFIEQLTGITNAAVAGAPAFSEVAEEVVRRLAGRVFVAHNARFDYAFIRNELKRLGLGFRADTLCTVRLSRRLYPQHYKHNLDSLIQRLGIQTDQRHRALADARVLAAFLRRLPADHAMERIQAAIGHVMAKPALPPHLPEDLVDDIPDNPGVYLFYGDDDMPLYVGRSSSLRTRVMSHFSGDHGSARGLRLSQQVKRIEWRETAGELGALLLEARLAKELQPLHNQRLRQESALCAWQVVDSERGGKAPALRHAAEFEFGAGAELYGLFTSQRTALQALRDLADAHRLCLIRLGLEKPARGGTAPCFGHRLQKCHGVCVGREDPLRHDLRLMAALARMKLQAWPYPGPVGVKEALHGREELHIVDRWRHLGTARDASEVAPILAGAADAAFDPDIYKILAKHLRGHAPQPLPVPAAA